MIDPITAIAAATSAFNIIKKGFEVGRDIEGMYGDMGRWMGAVSDIDQAEKMNRNPPLFKKIFSGSSIEEEAKKKAEAMELELRQYVNMVHGPESWNEIVALQAQIRKDRKAQIYAQQEKQRQVLNAIGIIILSAIFFCAVTFIFYYGVQMAGKPAPW